MTFVRPLQSVSVLGGVFFSRYLSINTYGEFFLLEFTTPLTQLLQNHLLNTHSISLWPIMGWIVTCMHDNNDFLAGLRNTLPDKLKKKKKRTSKQIIFLSSDYLILWKSNWVRRRLSFKVFWGMKQTNLSATGVLILYRTAHQDLRLDKFMFKDTQPIFTPRPPNLFHLFLSPLRCLQCWEHFSDPGSFPSINELSSLSVFPSFL